MEEITRFFGGMFRSILYRLRYRVTDATERQLETTIDRQFSRRQSKQQEQAEDDRK